MTHASDDARLRSTTICSVRRGPRVAIAGDGQVSLGPTIAKGDAVKVRRLDDVGADRAGVLVGFAGGAADAFALLERFETALEASPTNMLKAATELARSWRLDRALRRLESMLVIADRSTTLLLSGQGDVIEPTDGIAAVGSGGSYALAAARALAAHTDLEPGAIATGALEIAGEICVYTNTNVTMLEIA